MKVRLKGIGQAGEQHDLGLSTEWAKEAAQDAMETVPEAIRGTLELSSLHDDGRVDVRCQLETRGERVCERCGEHTQFEVEVDTLLLFFPEGRVPNGTGDIELDREDLDVGWYREGVIDLADVVREALILGMPPRVLCAEADSCDARTRSLLEKSLEGMPKGHPAFAALRNLY